MMCEADAKLATLLGFVRAQGRKKYMLFLSTCACVEYFTVVLKALLKDLAVFGIHGKMKNKRTQIFDFVQSRGIRRGCAAAERLVRTI
ncbi:unnamed protein product, partial [Timema podura]|nr:unnamed protein product [Timema podura]